MIYVFYILDYIFLGRIKGLRAAAHTWLYPLEIVSNVSRFVTALNWNRFLRLSNVV